MASQIQALPIFQKEGRVWLQKTELNSYFLLANHGMNDVAFPAATPTGVQAQSNQIRTGSVFIDVTQGDTELATFTVPTRILQSRNFLMGLTAEKVNVQLHTGPGGNFTQYGGCTLGFSWILCLRGPATTDIMAIMDNAGEGIPASFEVPFTATIGPVPIDWGTALESKTMVAAGAGSDVFALPPLPDETPAKRILAGDVVFIATLADTLGFGEVYVSTDGLRTAPVKTTTDPFVADEDLMAVVGFGDKVNHRIIVAREPNAGVPEIAYTDDDGATAWIPAAVGAVVTEGVNQLWIVDASKVYGVGGLAASSGKIWESNDGGANWSESDPGTGDAFNDIEVKGNGFGLAVGAANTVAVATDFDDWTAKTGPVGGAGDAFLCCSIKTSTGTAFAGNDAGELYATQDRGDTWIDVTTTIQGFTPTSINEIQFDDLGEFGYMSISTASAERILRSTDGGNSWEDYSLGVAGLGTVKQDGIHVVGPNHVLTTGALDAAVATLLLAQSNFVGLRQV